MVPSLIGVVDKLGADHVRSTILAGAPKAKPPMPPFASKLTADDVNNVIAFLASAK
jgi:mono/diheme cytochrome c family protein